MLATAVVFAAMQHASTAPLRCEPYPPSPLTRTIGEFDTICPMSPTWPWWTVTVYHDPPLMQQRRRCGGDTDEHGLIWSYEENDEPIGDDAPTHWWRAQRFYGNVDLNWLADTRDAAPQLLALDSTLTRLHSP